MCLIWTQFDVVSPPHCKIRGAYILITPIWYNYLFNQRAKEAWASMIKISCSKWIYKTLIYPAVSRSSIYSTGRLERTKGKVTTPPNVNYCWKQEKRLRPFSHILYILIAAFTRGISQCCKRMQMFSGGGFEWNPSNIQTRRMAVGSCDLL